MIFVERLHNRRAVHRDCAVHAGVKVVVAAQRGAVSVEDEPDDLLLLVEDGRAGVAADDVVVAHEVETHAAVELLPGLVPALRQRERLAAGLVRERASEVGERRDLGAAQREALHRAVAQAQREGRVGIDLGSLEREAGTRNRLGGRRLGRGRLVLVPAAHCARVGVDGWRRHDGRDGGDASTAAWPPS